jgi:hypothetical protein
MRHCIYSRVVAIPPSKSNSVDRTRKLIDRVSKRPTFVFKKRSDQRNMNLDEVLHKTMVDVREHELSGMVCNDTNGLCLAGIRIPLSA